MAVALTDRRDFPISQLDHTVINPRVPFTKDVAVRLLQQHLEETETKSNATFQYDKIRFDRKGYRDYLLYRDIRQFYKCDNVPGLFMLYVIDGKSDRHTYESYKCRNPTDLSDIHALISAAMLDRNKTLPANNRYRDKQNSGRITTEYRRIVPTPERPENLRVLDTDYVTKPPRQTVLYASPVVQFEQQEQNPTYARRYSVTEYQPFLTGSNHIPQNNTEGRRSVMLMEAQPVYAVKDSTKRSSATYQSLPRLRRFVYEAEDKMELQRRQSPLQHQQPNGLYFVEERFMPRMQSQLLYRAEDVPEQIKLGRNNVLYRSDHQYPRKQIMEMVSVQKQSAPAMRSQPVNMYQTPVKLVRAPNFSYSVADLNVPRSSAYHQLAFPSGNMAAISDTHLPYREDNRNSKIIKSPTKTVELVKVNENSPRKVYATPPTVNLDQPEQHRSVQHVLDLATVRKPIEIVKVPEAYVNNQAPYPPDPFIEVVKESQAPISTQKVTVVKSTKQKDRTQSIIDKRSKAVIFEESGDSSSESFGFLEPSSRNQDLIQVDPHAADGPKISAHGPVYMYAQRSVHKGAKN
ncbi:uncharacterized protein DEA37_0007572 [Paragonimus westermani]|uniref:Trematode PH-like domain-containing protein n=1 Tax=Paragonimus westermani TaxID=34504 RepID=A0A5J4NKF3_9TREM|nr:uncharacterized protein DEA37_0007572 [Paragonimus westermani]